LGTRLPQSVSNTA